MKFFCDCGFESDLIEAFQKVVQHMKICERFRSESPLTSLLGQQPLHQIPLYQLLIVKADFTANLEKIDQQVTALLKPKEDPLSLNKYKRFSESKQQSEINGLKEQHEKLEPQQERRGEVDKQDSKIGLESIFEKPKFNQYWNVEQGPQNDNKQYAHQVAQGTPELSDLQEEKPNTISCERCRGQFLPYDNQVWYLESCSHMYCRACLEKIVNGSYFKDKGKIKCPEISCESIISDQDILLVLGQEQMDQLVTKLIKATNNIATCVKCHQDFFIQKGEASDIIKDKNGQILKDQALQSYISNRFVCCNVEQCSECQATPFHVGFTCQEFKENKSGKNCRLCENPMKGSIDDKLPLALQYICDNKDCQESAKGLCQKQLKCGHFCQGTLKERECLPCLNAECSQTQKEDDYCNVCFTEGLRSQPCVQTSCGHIFHEVCMSKRLETRWNGPRINFNYCDCPLCKKPLQFAGDKVLLNEKLLKAAELRELIYEQAEERLQAEGRMNDEKLKDPKSPFYKQPELYSMEIFCFYECYKCKNPYFGGIKNCQANLDNESIICSNIIIGRAFDEKDLICPECCPITFESKCKKHGSKFIEFKCRFCCSVAVWFCGGTTHYCDPCHSGQRQQVAPCKGPLFCPLKVAHPPHGEESALGCAMCRYQRMEQT